MENRDPSSFRDPSGYIYVENGEIFRKINPSYFDQFNQLIDSGLYSLLTDAGMLIQHELIVDADEEKIIRPEQLELITYPYEWSFSQLKDAALLTLKIHLAALNYGMVLKDATAFNIQFQKGKPIFIDTLSFDFYGEEDPWMAYGQFCRFFLAPLLLIKFITPDANRLQLLYIDGIPLEVASAMLPLKTHFDFFIKTNIHMHANSLRKHREGFAAKKTPRLTLSAHKNIVNSMINYIGGLQLTVSTEWSGYYDQTNYADAGFKFKEQVVSDWITKYGLKRLWDVGGNNGHFARLLLEQCEMIICSDIDALAVDENYRMMKKNREENIVPMMIDFTSPPAGLGFDNSERPGFLSRMSNAKLDCVLALALVHHLSISNNCSFEMLASLFGRFAKNLIIEFVDPEDSWAEKLLKSKRHARHLFDFYNKQNFEATFSRHFTIKESVEVPGSMRKLYLMVRK